MSEHLSQKALSTREYIADIDPQFPARWSPRAFDPKPISDGVLSRIIEAARWAPSAFNAQPWRFYTSTERTHQDYVKLLMEFNQEWAKNAPVIGFLVGKKLFDHNGKPNPSYHFDCGAAWMALALQAQKEGLHTHGMGGIHYQAVAEYFHLDPDTEAVMMGFVIGRIGDEKQLSDTLREREQPSTRHSLETIWPSQSVN